ASCSSSRVPFRQGALVIHLVIALAPLLHSATPPPSIVANDNTDGEAVQFSAVDGSSFWYVPCGGDLTHNGAPRWFLHAEATGTTNPDGSGHTELSSYDEDCHLGLALSSNAGLYRAGTHWSYDG